MRHFMVGVVALLSAVAAPVTADVPVTLDGSPESMVRQDGVARAQEYAFAETPADLRELERAGELVRLEGDTNYELADFVRYSEARPEMRTFIERFSAQYRDATGEKLVVTSLSRPEMRQPGNSHELSVHPAGMAVDLRVSDRAASRRWLEDTLLSLERRDVLDVTREFNPPHYHVALFPDAYMAHVTDLRSEEAEREAAESPHAAGKIPERGGPDRHERSRLAGDQAAQPGRLGRTAPGGRTALRTRPCGGAPGPRGGGGRVGAGRAPAGGARDAAPTPRIIIGRTERVAKWCAPLFRHARPIAVPAGVRMRFLARPTEVESRARRGSRSRPSIVVPTARGRRHDISVRDRPRVRRRMRPTRRRSRLVPGGLT